MNQINARPGNPVLVGLMMSGVIAAGIELAGVITGAHPENLDFALKFCVPAAGFLIALLSWRDDYPKSLPPGKARLFFKTTYLGGALFHIPGGIVFIIGLLHYTAAFPDGHRAPLDCTIVLGVGAFSGMITGIQEQAIVRRRWLLLLAPIEIGVAAVLSLLLSSTASRKPHTVVSSCSGNRDIGPVSLRGRRRSSFALSRWRT